MKRVLLILALVAVVALPFVLRPKKTAGQGKADGTVVIIPRTTRRSGRNTPTVSRSGTGPGQARPLKSIGA